MKQIFLSLTLVATASLMCANCGNNSGNNNADSDSVVTATDSTDKVVAAEIKDILSEWPWDYPSDVKPNAKEGEYVLCPFKYAENIQNNKTNKKDDVYIYYAGELLSLGDKTSKVKSLAGREHEIPNTLILPIPEGQTANAGDILLTWWQGGSGMQTAIVTEASDPTQPTASFLDLQWQLNKDGSLREATKRGAKLKPNSFFVLKEGEISVGQKVMYPQDGTWHDATIVSISGDKAMLCRFANRLIVVDLNDLKPIPYHQGIKTGDNVYGIHVSYFKEGFKVDKVDNKEGRVWVTTPFDEKQVLSILKVMKSL